MSEDKLTFETELDSLEFQVKEKQAAFDVANAEMGTLIKDLVTAKTSERPALVKKRASLNNELGALSEELNELRRQRDVARLAPYLLAEVEAQAEVDHCNALVRDLDEREKAALDARQAYLNGQKGHLFHTPETDREFIKLEHQITGMKGVRSTLVKDVERAQLLLRQAKGQTEHIRRELQKA